MTELFKKIPVVVNPLSTFGFTATMREPVSKGVSDDRACKVLHTCSALDKADYLTGKGTAATSILVDFDFEVSFAAVTKPLPLWFC